MPQLVQWDLRMTRVVREFQGYSNHIRNCKSLVEPYYESFLTAGKERGGEGRGGGGEEKEGGRGEEKEGGGEREGAGVAMAQLDAYHHSKKKKNHPSKNRDCTTQKKE